MLVRALLDYKAAKRMVVRREDESKKMNLINEKLKTIKSEIDYYSVHELANTGESPLFIVAMMDELDLIHLMLAEGAMVSQDEYDRIKSDHLIDPEISHIIAHAVNVDDLLDDELVSDDYDFVEEVTFKTVDDFELVRDLELVRIEREAKKSSGKFTFSGEDIQKSLDDKKNHAASWRKVRFFDNGIYNPIYKNIDTVLKLPKN